ncbi:electron transfer flavoprotein subunit alpha/FixB family protein [Pontibacter sp. JAM-7]|uniref:electron transfer flavoprotein subunit alpha/FixB family protein n=1 Tax=Pontibacter sp. JAM-7 TaxID=3366581 RepID=UPI003AF80484
MKTLIIAEHDNQTLKGATLSALSAASQLNQPTDLLIAGQGIDALCDSATRLTGLNQVLKIDNSALEHPLAELIAPLVHQLSGAYSHILLTSTSFGKDLAPRIAALCGVNQISDIITIMAPDTFKRPIYAGNAIATVKSRESRLVITLRSTAFAPLNSEAGSASVTTPTVDLPEAKVRFIRQSVSASDRPELSSAEIVVSGGRALGSKENFDLIYQLADTLGAAVGASRAAVDSGYVANDLQVGQTGQMVAPKLYIAVGISGAIQHLAGMKESGTIVAINKDEEAPIFGVADYGLVGDLFDLVPELTSKL